jgi:hypothetical protein
MTTFQILDSFAQDLIIENETDTLKEISFANDDNYESDGEYRTRRRRTNNVNQSNVYKPREMIIHLFGTTSDGTHLRVNLEGFEPFFYVKVPQDMKHIFELTLKDRASMQFKIECYAIFAILRTSFLRRKVSHPL